jgi:hypothetical protein
MKEYNSINLHFCPEEGGNMYLRNVGNHLQECTWTQPRTPKHKFLSPWKLREFILFFLLFNDALIVETIQRGIVRWMMNKTFLLSTSSRPALGPTLHPIQWVQRLSSSGVKRLEREAETTHLQLVPGSWIRGSMDPLPHTSSWRSV